MKLAIVVQRYGKDIIGGAEAHARIIAQKLAENKNWQIDVYTTTAKDYQTWKNAYTKGISYDGRVKVLRFPSIFPRFRYLFAIYKHLIYKPLKKISYLNERWGKVFEDLWFILQGPYCPSLINELAAKQTQYHKVFFFTYLYYPSIFGIPKIRDKAVVIPTAHDEPPLYFSRVKENFQSAASLLVNSPKELALVKSLDPALKKKISIAGVGLDPALTTNFTASSETGPTNPYLLFMGRVGKGKEVDTLISYFLTWQSISKQPLNLVLAGQLEKNLKIPAHPSIQYLGVVNEKTKIRLLSGSFAVVNPSPQESLSMLVLEGILAKKPIILNAKDPVLKSYAEAMPSVFSYASKDDFIKRLEFLNSHQWLAIKEGALLHSEKWVQDRYSWNKVMAIYRQTINCQHVSTEPV